MAELVMLLGIIAFALSMVSKIKEGKLRAQEMLEKREERIERRRRAEELHYAKLLAIKNGKN